MFTPPEEIFHDIKYFITGSRRFGTHKQDSDLDVCVCIDNINCIINRVRNSTAVLDNKHEMGWSGKLMYSQYNNGFKFNYQNKYNVFKINVIPLHPVDYVCWFHATKLMVITPLKKDKTRSEIHGMFEIYCGLMKNQFANENINIKNHLDYINE